jgi:hypothetical protein
MTVFVKTGITHSTLHSTAPFLASAHGDLHNQMSYMHATQMVVHAGLKTNLAPELPTQQLEKVNNFVPQTHLRKTIQADGAVAA